ncbi:MAG: hypothetical protein RMJ35_00350 [Phycisphaerales bacterium]|nr:hypothetical protein [Phycisphaerales bacterium]
MRADAVAKDLRAAADLLSDGRPGTLETLFSDCQSIRDAILSIRGELAEKGQIRAHGEPDMGFDQLEAAIRDLIQSERRAASQSAQEKARAMLELLDSIRCFDGEQPARIPEVDQMVAQLRSLLDTATAQDIPGPIEELVRGEHPLAALLALAGEDTQLPDDEFIRRLDQIRAAFSAHVFARAARGAVRLHVPEPARASEPATDHQTTEGEGRTTPQQSASSPAAPARPGTRDEKEEAAPGSPDENVGAGTNQAATGDVHGIGHEAGASSPAGIMEEPEAAPAPPATDQTSPIKHGFEDQKGSSEALNQPEAAAAPAPPEEWLRLSRILDGLIARQKLWAAWALAQWMEARDIGAPLTVPPWVLRAAAVGPHVASAEDAHAAILQEDLRNFSDSLFPGGEHAYNWNLRLLLVAATLRAALIAPQTGAAAVLQSLHLGGADRLLELSRLVAEFGQRYHISDTSLVSGLRGLAALQEEKARLAAEARTWFDQAPTFTFKFAPATKVWQRWLEGGRIVRQLIAPILGDAPFDVEALQQAIGRAAGEAWFRSEVRKTDRRDNGRVGGRDITADALEQLRRRLGEAARFAQRFLGLTKQEQEWRNASHVLQQAMRLRDELLRLAPGAEEDIARLASGSLVSPTPGAAGLCRAALGKFLALFQPEDSGPERTADPGDLMLCELLPIPGIEITGRWIVSWSDTDGALEMLESLASGKPLDMGSVLRSFAMEGDFRRSSLLLEILQRVPGELLPENLASLEEEHGSRLREARLQLRNELLKVRMELEDAVAHGLLNEMHRTDLNVRLESAEANWMETLDVSSLLNDVRGVSREIRERKEQQIAECRRRLEAELPMDHPSRARILEVLDRGDVLTAHEWIDLVLGGNELPDSSPADEHFMQFFGKLPDLFARLERRQNPRSIIDDISHRNAQFDRDLLRITGAEAARAARALQAWHEMKRSSACENDQLREVLSFLGFELPEVNPLPGERSRWYQIKTRPLADRVFCPVPRYGSMAAGRYLVMCSWERPNEEALLRDAAEQKQAPVIVFFFGRLTEFRRRNLARLCRERAQTCLVLDDLLMLHLCTVSGLRLPAFFSCTLPFTYVRAYVTSAGPLPPEMFYGRREALESILNPQGTCFIYGGRQLGKTALLKEAQRRFHDPEHDRYAVWIDLKTSGIGYHSHVDGIWRLLAEELARVGVDAAFQPPSDAADFEAALAAWMAANPQRKLLLLLDEADRFLLEDARREHGSEFARASLLKGLMDRTERRFKVVFAGLHDVQRTTTLANHPLAHFGTPVCVGPLLDRGEWKEARALIEVPFAQLGYRFENPALVTRILSQTNYYPSLIQVYCEHLFDHLMRSPAATHDWNAGPPYLIRSSDVEGVYRSRELRSAIRDRFLWTLQLDKRYEVIAYTLAYEVISSTPEARSRLLTEGIDAITLQRSASSWWPEGFRETRSVESFQCLLHEMVGLGILRYAGAARYGLRSPNVLNLLGTEDEIQAKLLEPREPDLRYEPTRMRTPLGDPLDGKRSPLTWQQESLLRGDPGLCLIIGNAAAGLGEVSQRLEQLYAGQSFVSVAPCQTRREFKDELRRLAQQRAAVCAVPPEVEWNLGWLNWTAAWLCEQDAARRTRVLFLCDPSRLWQLLGSDGNLPFDSLPLVPTLITLSPWADDALRVWLDDCQISATLDERREISDATGNWPAVLYRFLELARESNSWRAAIRRLQQELQPGEKFLTDCSQLLGLDHREAGETFRHLVEIGEATDAELEEVLGSEIGPEKLRRTMGWARLLNLASHGKGGRFDVDPFVERIVRSR